MRTDARRTRHRTFTEGLECEPWLAVPLVLAFLALGAFVMGAGQAEGAEDATRYWVGLSTAFLAAHCLFMLVYDSPKRHKARVARGCPHIHPRPEH
jgi:hypothetical protein